MASASILLLIFVAVVALALLGQLVALLLMARKLSALADSVTPLLPSLDQGARALPGLVRDTHALVTEVRAPLQAAAANLLEISAIARDRVQYADQLAADIGERLELQLVRLDEAVGNAMAGIEQVSNTVRDSLLRPVRDVNALVHGVRTGVDFFFRRRAGTPAAPAYQEDEEMFI